MRLSSLAFAFLALVALACSRDEEPACFAGDLLACECPGSGGSARGFRACDAARTAYGACVCDGTTPGVDAGLGSVARDAGVEDAAASTKLGFLAVCIADSDCESGLCFPFAAKGSRCTRTCKPETAATDCPAPSTGCNNQGVCKVP